VQPTYQVRLDAFEGPLDLLLHLIKKEELDIYDIPISRVTRQYLEYIEMMRMLDLDVAGEFLVMASDLMRIKARMLLPRPEEEEEEGVDPRADLVRRLIEYKQFKEVAVELKGREGDRLEIYTRGWSPEVSSEPIVEVHEASIFQLLDVMRTVMFRLGQESVHRVTREEIKVEQKMDDLLAALEPVEGISFRSYVETCRSKMEVLVVFVALLELIREGRVIAFQKVAFGEIWICRVREGDDDVGEW
jgi:segregation and condensation protein A